MFKYFQIEWIKIKSDRECYVFETKRKSFRKISNSYRDSYRDSYLDNAIFNRLKFNSSKVFLTGKAIYNLFHNMLNIMSSNRYHSFDRVYIYLYYNFTYPSWWHFLSYCSPTISIGHQHHNTPECDVGDWYLMLVPNTQCWWRDLPPTSKFCHQHIWSSTSVTNIDVTFPTSFTVFSDQKNCSRMGTFQILLMIHQTIRWFENSRSFSASYILPFLEISEKKTSRL